jgi:hypothetical protein
MCRHFFFALGHSLTRKSFWKLCELTFKGAVSGYPKIPFTNTFGNRFFISVEYYIDKIPCGTVVFKPDKSVSVLNFHHLLNYVGKIKIFLNWGLLYRKLAIHTQQITDQLFNGALFSIDSPTPTLRINLDERTIFSSWCRKKQRGISCTDIRYGFS